MMELQFKNAFFKKSYILKNICKGLITSKNNTYFKVIEFYFSSFSLLEKVHFAIVLGCDKTSRPVLWLTFVGLVCGFLLLNILKKDLIYLRRIFSALSRAVLIENLLLQYPKSLTSRVNPWSKYKSSFNFNIYFVNTSY